MTHPSAVFGFTAVTGALIAVVIVYCYAYTVAHWKGSWRSMTFGASVQDARESAIAGSLSALLGFVLYGFLFGGWLGAFSIALAFLFPGGCFVCWALVNLGRYLASFCAEAYRKEKDLPVNTLVRTSGFLLLAGVVIACLNGVVAWFITALYRD
jgi:hypothetical protein